ncbi:hypothetical protein Golob_002265 [Gossypium lobatum]|uniref:Aminotransferase-like plant mobile domain-containing protein n=1 Tax=Gossypium lobatum TaxID=34289 RepID=A0A7J8N4Q7_9ROSI|nr:hypothetical protein [Gossypium lobatum]
MRDSCMCLECSWAANSILHSSAHWWKDEGSRLTFHLPYSECTITLEDVALQLSFSMNGSVATGLEVIPGKDDTCEEFLGKVLKKFYRDRIGIKWLETNFKYLPKDAPDIVKEQYAQAFILKLIEGILMPINHEIWWNHGQSCVGLLEQLEDILILLDQHSKDNVIWMDIIRRARDHIMRLVKIFGHLEYVGRKSAFDSVSDDENTQIESSNMAIRVEATNFTAIARHESTTQVGSTGKDQRELTRLSQRVHQHLGS